MIIIQCTSGCLINSGVSRLLGVIGWVGGMEGKQREMGGQGGQAGSSAHTHMVMIMMAGLDPKVRGVQR